MLSAKHPSHIHDSIPTTRRTAKQRQCKILCVSKRFQETMRRGASLYYQGWEKTKSNAFHLLKNPDGIIQLGLADNELSYDILDENLKDLPLSPLREYAGYTDTTGIPKFRKAMASIMNEILKPPPQFLASEKNVFTSDGASSMIEMIAWILGDPEDYFIVPSPCYAGFDVDLKLRSEVQIIPAFTNSSTSFTISEDSLESAWIKAISEGKKVRGVLFSSPSNPLGRILKEEEIKAVLSFARNHKIHVISDEIYAGSVYSNEENFVSILNFISNEDSPFVHVVYGLAKDFGIPGFRIGSIYTKNKDLIFGLSQLTRTTAVSSLTQEMLSQLLLLKPNFLKSYIEENNKRLLLQSSKVIEKLKSLNLPFVSPNSGLFLWVNFSSWLDTQDFKGEEKLFFDLLENAKVNISPGQAFHCAEPGWFRVCFASVENEILEIALERLAKFKENKIN